MKYPIIILSIACLAFAGCASPATIAKINSDLGTLQSGVTTVAAANTAAQKDLNGALPSLTGTLSTAVVNDESYANTTVADAQAAVTLLQTVAQVIEPFLTTTPTATASAYRGRYWTARGLCALHRYRVSPRDPMALAKLWRHRREICDLSGGVGLHHAISAMGHFEVLKGSESPKGQPRNACRISARPAQTLFAAQ